MALSQQDRIFSLVLTQAAAMNFLFEKLPALQDPALKEIAFSEMRDFILDGVDDATDPEWYDAITDSALQGARNLLGIGDDPPPDDEHGQNRS